MHKSASCIDFIFTDQPNVVMNSGIHWSLHQNCHNQIVFAKLNLILHYQPTYEHELWHFIKVNTDHIYVRYFPNLDTNDKVCLSNKTIRNLEIKKYHFS